MGDLWSALAKANTLIDFVERTGGPSGTDRARYDQAVATVRQAELEAAGGGLGFLPLGLLAAVRMAVGVLAVVAAAVGGAVLARGIVRSAETAERAAKWGIWSLFGAGAIVLLAATLPSAVRAYRVVQTV